MQLLGAAQPALQYIQPAFNKVWAQGKYYSIVGKKHVLHAYSLSRTKSQKAWQEAKPRLEKAWKDVKVSSMYLYLLKF